jgi:predicted ATPase
MDADEDGSEPLRLNLKETTDLIINLLKTNPATIIIDALDECDNERRPELLKALDRIIDESSSIAKVLVSSRDDNNIVCHLDRSPNIFIEAKDNGDDIKRFTQREVARSTDDKHLLSGKVSAELEKQITDTLIDRAQGM